MKATPADQANLVELQEVDLAIIRLGHKMKTHDLHQKVEELEGRIADLRRSVLAQTVDLSDQELKTRDLEKQVDQVKSRAALQQERLDSGKVPLRDMSAVEHEISRVVERQTELEDELLDHMGQVEKKESFLEKTKVALGAQEQDLKETRAQLAEALTEPQGQVEEFEKRREELRQQLPATVLDEYDHLRSRMGPLVVLKLKDGNLVDAPVSLTEHEIGRIGRAPEDELWYSEETGYLVVRV